MDKIDYIKLALKEILNKSHEATKDSFEEFNIKTDFGIEDAGSIEYLDGQSPLVKVSFQIPDSKMFVAVYLHKNPPYLVDETRIEYIKAVELNIIIEENIFYSNFSHINSENPGYKSFKVSNIIRDYVPSLVSVNVDLQDIYKYIGDRINNLLSLIKLNPEIITLLENSEEAYIDIVFWPRRDTFDGVDFTLEQIKQMNDLGLSLNIQYYTDVN